MTQSAPGEDPDAPADTKEVGAGGLVRRIRARKPPMNSVGEDPDYRFSLANERTFLAWIRTGLALLAGGVAVQLVPEFSFSGGRLTLGVILVVLSIAVSAGSYHRWTVNERSMRLGHSLQPSLIPRLLAAGLTVVALLGLVMVIVSG